MEIREGWNIIAGPFWAGAVESFNRWVEVKRAFIARFEVCADGSLQLDFADWGYLLTVRFGPDWSDWWMGWVSDTHPWDVEEGGWIQPAPEHVADGFPSADQDVITYLQDLGLEILEASREGREVVL